MTLVFKFTHSCERDLIIDFIHPDGATITVMNRGLERCDGPASYDSVNSSVANFFLNNQAAGTWTLVVKDDGAGNTGTLDFWSLDITVTAPAPTPTPGPTATPTPTPAPTPANDFDPPELLSVSVAPTTVDQDAGSITVDLSAQDASGVNYATIFWEKPGGGTALESCYFNGAETCTNTVAIDSSTSNWAFSGNYTFSYIVVYDVNGRHRSYYANGTTNSASGDGTHGFSFPDLTVN
jgi:subtilisin-like proprotein convertase family protein